MRSGIFVEKHAEKVIKLQKNSIICYGKENARQYQILLYQNCRAYLRYYNQKDFSIEGEKSSSRVGEPPAARVAHDLIFA